jgi:hypothetical protein
MLSASRSVGVSVTQLPLPLSSSITGAEYMIDGDEDGVGCNDLLCVSLVWTYATFEGNRSYAFNLARSGTQDCRSAT